MVIFSTLLHTFPCRMFRQDRPWKEVDWSRRSPWRKRPRMTTWRATRPYRNIASEALEPALCWPLLAFIGGTIDTIGPDGNFPRFSQINHYWSYSIHFCWTSWSLSQLQMFTAKVLRLQSLFKDVLRSWDQVRVVDVWAWAKTETAQTFG